jgi:hypothetical protein
MGRHAKIWGRYQPASRPFDPAIAAKHIDLSDAEGPKYKPMMRFGSLFRILTKSSAKNSRQIREKASHGRNRNP